MIKVNFCTQLDLEFYKNYPIINYNFEIFNDNDTVYDFSNSTGVFFKLLAKKNGSLLALLNMAYSVSDNFIYLNDTGSSPSIISQRTPRTAWYEVYSTEGGSNKLLFYGVAEL